MSLKNFKASIYINDTSNFDKLLLKCNHVWIVKRKGRWMSFPFNLESVLGASALFVNVKSKLFLDVLLVVLVLHAFA